MLIHHAHLHLVMQLQYIMRVMFVYRSLLTFVRGSASRPSPVTSCPQLLTTLVDLRWAMFGVCCLTDLGRKSSSLLELVD